MPGSLRDGHNYDETWTLLVVHSQQVNHPICTPLRSIPQLLPVESAIINFNKIDQLRVCPGQPDKHFVKLIQKRKRCIKTADGTLVASVDNHSIVVLNGEKFD